MFYLSSFAYSIFYGVRKTFETTRETLCPRDSRSDRIARTALSHQPIKNLYEQASRTPGYRGELGSYKIEFVAKTRTGFEASCNPDTRTIELLNSLSDKNALAYFVFELINAKEYTKHIQNYNKFLLSKDSNKFAKDSERLEYENTIEHYNIVKAADLGSDYVIWGERKPEDFEKIWTDQLETSSHGEYWRSNGKSLGKLTANSKMSKLPIIGLISLAILGAGILWRNGFDPSGLRT